MVVPGLVGRPLSLTAWPGCLSSGDTYSGVTVEWGDGTSSAGSITQRQDYGFFADLTVNAQHLYTQPGSFNPRLEVTDASNGRAYERGTGVVAEISPAPTVVTPAPAPEPPPQSPGVQRPRPIATSPVRRLFVRGHTLVPRVVALVATSIAPDELSASISWGDSRVSFGHVAIGAGGRLVVGAGHTWRRSGRYVVTIRILDRSRNVLAQTAWRAMVRTGRSR
jgi:uncharacterized protein